MAPGKSAQDKVTLPLVILPAGIMLGSEQPTNDKRHNRPSKRNRDKRTKLALRFITVAPHRSNPFTFGCGCVVGFYITQKNKVKRGQGFFLLTSRPSFFRTWRKI